MHKCLDCNQIITTKSYCVGCHDGICEQIVNMTKAKVVGEVLDILEDDWCGDDVDCEEYQKSIDKIQKLESDSINQNDCKLKD